MKKITVLLLFYLFLFSWTADQKSCFIYESDNNQVTKPISPQLVLNYEASFENFFADFIEKNLLKFSWINVFGPKQEFYPTFFKINHLPISKLSDKFLSLDILSSRHHPPTC